MLGSQSTTLAIRLLNIVGMPVRITNKKRLAKCLGFLLFDGLLKIFLTKSRIDWQTVPSKGFLA